MEQADWYELERTYPRWLYPVVIPADLVGGLPHKLRTVLPFAETLQVVESKGPAVQIDGVLYRSMQEAAAALGVSMRKIRSRLERYLNG